MTSEENYDRLDAFGRARHRFQPLIDALTSAIGLDVEPVIDNTGGGVMCLGIYWPESAAFVWISDYWWDRDSLILGLYDHAEAGLDGPDSTDVEYPEVPGDLLMELDANALYESTATRTMLAEKVAAWMAPFIAAHGQRFGWSSRFEPVP